MRDPCRPWRRLLQARQRQALLESVPQRLQSPPPMLVAAALQKHAIELLERKSISATPCDLVADAEHLQQVPNRSRDEITRFLSIALERGSRVGGLKMGPESY